MDHKHFILNRPQVKEMEASPSGGWEEIKVLEDVASVY